MLRIFILLLIIAIIAGLAWIVYRQRSGTVRRKRRSDGRGRRIDVVVNSSGLEKLRDNPMFWGVAIGQPGCEAARELLGRQYSFDAAPQLPLEGCSSANCTCQYKGLKEHRTTARRQHEERRSDVRFHKDHPPDRRSRKDRRRGNVWIGHDY